MEFNPDDANADALPEGEYDAEIVKAEEKTSSKGNPMLVVTLKLFASSGTGFATDYIVTPATLFKLKKLCKAIGLEAKFAKGKITPNDLIGMGVRVFAKLEEDASGTYPDKNTIAKYLPPQGAVAKAKSPQAVAANNNEDLDIAEESIPF